MIKHWFFDPVPCLEDEAKVKESSNKSTGSSPEEAKNEIKSTKGGKTKDSKNEITEVDKKDHKEKSNTKTSIKLDKDSEKKPKKNVEKSSAKSDESKKKSKKISEEKSKEKSSTAVDFAPSNDLANDKTYKRVLRQTHVDKYKLKVVREEKKVVREELLNEKIKAEIDEIRSRIPSKSP